MRIKIVKCTDPSYWYAKRIGEVFEVQYITKEYGDAVYWCREGGAWNCINKVKPEDIETVD